MWIDTQQTTVIENRRGSKVIGKKLIACNRNSGPSKSKEATRVRRQAYARYIHRAKLRQDRRSILRTQKGWYRSRRGYGKTFLIKQTKTLMAG